MGFPETPETLLKKLAVEISEHNEDVAIRVYEAMRALLLDKRNGSPLNEQNFVKAQSPRADRVLDVLEFDKFLVDHRTVRQYLESVNPVAANQFMDLSDQIQNKKNGNSVERVGPLKFLMAMAKKKNVNESILAKEVKTSLPRVKPLKAQAPLPPDVAPKPVNIPPIGTSLDLTKPSTSRPRASPSPSHSNGSLKKAPEPKQQESLLKCSRMTESNTNMDVGGDISEWDVIEGLLFVWQGVQNKIFRRCERTQNYFLHEKWRVYPWIREQADNLASLGYLHDTLLPFSENPPNGGLIRKCFAAFVRDQLSDYYSLIASVRTEFQKQTADWSGTLTLDFLRLQSAGVSRTFMDLISIAEMTKDDKGGYLASGVFCFIRHGDPDLQNLVKSILARICQPLYGMLTKWLIDGTLSDQSKEFFIAADNNINEDRLWHDKYSIRMEMLPEFIPQQLADKALSVGRSINFLRERCNNEQAFSEPEKIKNLFNSRSADVMYLNAQGNELEELVDQAYEETNKRVLEVIMSKYSLLDHFQAHRKFLLLGQGDFIHHLMDLLMDALDKPSTELHPHYLNSILDSAIRATTAQFEPDDIINRLGAATLVRCNDGEPGWEVFYLSYAVEGPIGTVFSKTCRDKYQQLFCALWKAKRIEMILSKSWKHQITSAKMLRRIGELAPALRRCHELTAEMLHFVQQTQYYFLFEVMECAWNMLIDDVLKASNLTDVINAHSKFLDNVTSGVFKDENKENLAVQLRVIYDRVLSLVKQVDDLLRAGEREARERAQAGVGLANLCAGEGSKVEYLKKRRDFVHKFIPEASAGLRVEAETYRRSIKGFLLMLNSEMDLSLQLLSVRLDFNSYYKQLDSMLEAPLTFQHRRMSSIGSSDLSPILTRRFSMEKKTKRKV